MLSNGGMGWTGITPAIYATYSDWCIINVLFAERDKDGAVIPEWQLADGVADLIIEESQSSFKTEEELQIPPEVFRWGHPNHSRNVPQQYVLLFWQVWRERKVSTEEIMAKWKEVMASVRFVYR